MEINISLKISCEATELLHGENQHIALGIPNFFRKIRLSQPEDKAKHPLLLLQFL